jgi:uncharacterized RDD family membrane protein YckC
MTNPYAPPVAEVLDIPAAAEEQVPAPRATRLGAYLLDSVIFGAKVYMPFTFGSMFSGVTATSRAAGFGVGLLLGCIGFAVWAWITVKDVMANGQSIAKKMLGIKVVQANGTPASLGRIFWRRNVINVIIGAVPILGAIYNVVDVLFIFGESQQCLHDKIADTIVVIA